ncbi:hypothetical protein QQ054_33455 [Oscillatoria amoena NRMC-F 0135]|nr:hypothetical protein [Oscillatoria amoena NRMC-F 0135]
MAGKFLLIILVGISISWHLNAQSSARSSKKKKKDEPEANQSQPSSLQPYYPTKNYEPEKKKSKKSAGKITYDARDKFYDRMEQIARQERKNEKEMQKPQNSDPMYFGHKRPPRKRSPEKMKFCKVCGIRH